MAAIARTIIILLNYLVVYHAYGAFEGSVGSKKKIFFPAKNPVDARREVVCLFLCRHHFFYLRGAETCSFSWIVPIFSSGQKNSTVLITVELLFFD